MRGLRVLPHCSVPWEGKMGKGKPLTHTAKSPGDRISGFNGLITQGPPELYPGSGVGRGRGVPRRRRRSHYQASSSTTVSSLCQDPCGRPPRLLRSGGESLMARLLILPGSAQRGRVLLQNLVGIHNSAMSWGSPKRLVGTRIFISLAVICLSVLLTQGQGWVCRVSGSEPTCPRALALRAPWQANRLRPL